jgi:hypothetical protein
MSSVQRIFGAFPEVHTMLDVSSHDEFRLLVCLLFACFGRFGCREPREEMKFSKNDLVCA